IDVLLVIQTVLYRRQTAIDLRDRANLVDPGSRDSTDLGGGEGGGGGAGPDSSSRTRSGKSRVARNGVGPDDREGGRGRGGVPEGVAGPERLMPTLGYFGLGTVADADDDDDDDDEREGEPRRTDRTTDRLSHSSDLSKEASVRSGQSGNHGRTREAIRSGEEPDQHDDGDGRSRTLFDVGDEDEPDDFGGRGNRDVVKEAKTGRA
ncbi:hypothetical protein JCM10212_003158, partial [Sporobolomyces blumeae]